jgi:hypothetical protein
MAKHQVFLIHGMGEFEAGWSLQMQAEMRKSFNAYEKVKEAGLADRFELVEIAYDAVFEDWRKMWKEDAEAAAKAAKLLGLDSGVADTLVSLAQSTNGDDFARTHIVDVVMYRYLRQVQEQVNQRVRKQIVERLDAFPKGDLPQWSAVAHSLGTAVLHDTLHAMFTQPVEGVLLGDAYMPAYLFMIANVGKVLWNKGGDFYNSVVKPHPVDTMGVCWKYDNFLHALDPIPQVDPFDPPASWFPPNIPRERVFANVVLPKDDVQDLNVHALSHYWSHPAVHVEIIGTLTDMPELITQKEYNAALKKWRDDRLATKKRNEVRAALQAYLDKQTAPWSKVVERIFEFREAILGEGLDPREGES